ncbi:hypothetical protein [Legionella sp. km772]|uniref:hypothetical protein n=1 Tax=Legionella sp. km772 TaxID=2498111 RepID=UPI000F8DBBE0|nr:hypothetical protein [Legionella sp. km772]RUR10400.1 hypothetical protein ELY15_08170 [Legionella sp. km772]
MPQVDHLEKNMPLSSYNVHQQLVTRIQHFLTHTNIPFSVLKSYITARKPLDEIHDAIVMELNKIEATDKEEAKANLERKALENQKREDQSNSQLDERNSDKDDLERVRLINDRAITISLQQQLELQLRLLEQQIAVRKAQEVNTHQHGHPSTTGGQTVNEHSHPSESAPQTQGAHEHGHPSETTGRTHEHRHSSETTSPTHSHPSSQSAKAISPDVLQADNIRQQLSAIGLKLIQMNSALSQVEVREQQRKAQRREREKRLEAQLHLAQQKSGVTIADALTSSNYKVLQSDIKAAHNTLSAKCASLTKEAQQSNYPSFIQELESSLSALTYSAPEKEALQTILALRKQYQTYTELADSLQDQLNRTLDGISFSQDQLQKANARVILLKQTTPYLLRQNSDLSLKNTQLAQAQLENNQRRDKFSLPAWILAGLALVTSIPLVLALSGVLAVSLTPVLFYTLLSIIPGLSFATSFGLGITALVYGAKAAGNGRDLIGNENTIRSNIAQMEKNNSEITELQNQTIPSYLKALDENRQNQIEQKVLLQEKRLLAQEALHQAESIEPGKALHHTTSSASKWDIPPSYDAMNRNSFFSLVPYHAHGTMPKPSAPPIELMEDSSTYSYH